MVITVEQIDLWRSIHSENQNLEFKEAKNQFEKSYSCLLSTLCVAMGYAE